MTPAVQRLHEQPLGAFERDADDRAVPVQTFSQVVQAGDVMGELALLNDPTGSVQQAQLMV